MRDNPTGLNSAKIDEALLAAHPELAVLTLDLPDSDGEPMDTERHRLQMNLILDLLTHHWKDRQDFYAAGNMFLYYCSEQARQIIAEEAEPTRPRRAFRGPDVFIVLNVDGSFARRKWVVWEEGGRYPDVIFEFLSPSTRRADQTTKKDLYERIFKTPEYYWYDPFDPSVLQGWRLSAEEGYRAVTPDERGWLWSPALHMWIGCWEGVYKRRPATWLRCYDQEGQVVLTSDEGAEQRAEAEHARAEAERTQAEAERARAEAAEAEVARLRAELARLRGERR